MAISWNVRIDGSVGSALLQFGVRLAAGDNRLYALDMSESHLRSMPPIADDMPRTDFRLMVRASKPGSKLFVWTILREDQDCIPIMQSSTTFRSLEDAYVAGSVALDKFRTHRERCLRSCAFQRYKVIEKAGRSFPYGDLQVIHSAVAAADGRSGIASSGLCGVRMSPGKCPSS